MKLRVLAVGARGPQWVDEAFTEYAKRLPRGNSLQLVSVNRAPKSTTGDTAREIEGERLLSKVGRTEQIIALDEHGECITTAALAARMSAWRMDGIDVALLIGGPDGLAETVRKKANFIWSLSPLTFPHGLARAIVAEQLYRAWTVLTGHPYHRA